MILALLAACGTQDFGTCRAAGSCTDLEATALVDVEDEWELPSDATGVYEDEASWQAVWSVHGIAAPGRPVDWDTEKVLLASLYVSTTCGFDDLSWRVERCGDVDALTLSATDTSGRCDIVCDGEASVVVAVVVPRDRDARACATLRERCD